MPGVQHLKPRSALFRCDASPEIGGGHVMRCLTLAGELARQGYAVTLAVAPPSRETVRMLDRAGVELVEIERPADAAELKARLDRSFDLAVVDHYGLDAAYETPLREIAGSILVIDDLADRPYDCDVLLDQTFGRDAADYAGLVPEHAHVLAGSRYALLRPEFAAARPGALQRRQAGGPVRRILISLGMTDIGGVSALALEAALAAGTGAAIDIVLGSAAASLPDVRALADRHDAVTVHVDSADIVALMIEADIAVGAAGSTTWERCCLGLPTLTLLLATNQQLVYRSLAAKGAFEPVAEISRAALLEGIGRLVDSATLRTEISRSASAIVDGEGVCRVAAFLQSTIEDEDPAVRLVGPTPRGSRHL